MTTIGEIVRLTVSYAMSGASEAQNVFYFQAATSNTDLEMLDALETWVTDDWGSRWANMVPTGADIVRINASVVDALGTVVRDLGVRPLAISGTAVGEVSAGAVAATIFAATGRPKTRGRKFIPGIGETNLLNGFLTPITLADLALLLVLYFEGFSFDGVTVVAGIISTVTSEFIPFDPSGGFDDIPDYQRRRRPDRGS